MMIVNHQTGISLFQLRHLQTSPKRPFLFSNGKSIGRGGGGGENVCKVSWLSGMALFLANRRPPFADLYIYIYIYLSNFPVLVLKGIHHYWKYIFHFFPGPEPNGRRAFVREPI